MLLHQADAPAPATGQAVRGWSDFFAPMALPLSRRRLDAGSPFLVLDDARESGAAFVLGQPRRTLVAREIGEVRECLAQARRALAEGEIVAGFMSYEAGAAFEPRLAGKLSLSDREPLVWFGCFDEVVKVDNLADLLPPAIDLQFSSRPEWSRASHRRATDAILELIRAGDIYQANLTFPTRLAIVGDPMAYYCAIRRRQAAGWGGVLFTGQEWLLSASPELFFTLADEVLEARPMKGTAAREGRASADALAIETLRNSAKERAENLMIVDLIRNDFSRISQPGSVRVPELFAIETYPTIHQMTSRITARIKPGRDAIDVLEACFPCGSVTGAPKLRAMEVIADTELQPRGSYTGSLGIMLPDGSAAFNVLIRTLRRTADAEFATVNVGSGITAGSTPDMEWDECMTKLAFARGLGAT